MHKICHATLQDVDVDVAVAELAELTGGSCAPPHMMSSLGLRSNVGANNAYPGDPCSAHRDVGRYDIMHAPAAPSWAGLFHDQQMMRWRSISWTDTLVSSLAFVW